MEHAIRLALAVVTMQLGAAAAHAQNTWGDIKGRVVWAPKEIPQQQPIEPVKKHADAAQCLKNGPVLDEQWVVNAKNRGLRWTFVWLANENAKNNQPLPIHPKLKAVPKEDVEIDQPCCAFIPHAVALRQGQTLVAKNSSLILHNVRFIGPNNPINVAIPAHGKKTFQLVAERLPARVECSVHPWMRGYVGIFDHPYFAVTDADGKFEIKDAPAGKYRLIVYNDHYLGSARLKCPVIVVPAGKALDVGNLAFAP